jgi:hypothetical protein
MSSSSWMLQFGEMMLIPCVRGCSTTTDLTTNLSMAIARMLGLESVEDVIEYIVRGVSSLVCCVRYEADVEPVLFWP